MRVREERLKDVRLGRWSPRTLRRINPVVLEAVTELCGRSAGRSEARRAAGLFARAVGLDDRDAPRISVSVAARAVEACQALSRAAIEAQLREAIGEDPLLALVCDELLGHRSTGAPRPADERDLVARALCVVLQMASSQQEVDRLEDIVDGGRRRRGS